MAALLVAIAILSVMLLVALPTWRHQAQREREAELIFRGEQYARAIALYQRKLGGSLPPNLDILVEQKFLRRKYKDPITGEDFMPIAAGAAGAEAMQAPGAAPDAGRGAGRGSPGPGRGTPGPTTFQSPMGGARQGSPSPMAPGAGVGIVGVRSKSTAQSIRLYNGRDRHDQWLFMYMAASQQGVPGTAPVQPGQTVAPGQRGRGTPPPPGRGRGGRGF
ncbi:MAG TPA: type II secretion system protein [Vicinamibacterales bacterium]